MEGLRGWDLWKGGDDLVEGGVNLLLVEGVGGGWEGVVTDPPAPSPPKNTPPSKGQDHVCA